MGSRSLWVLFLLASAAASAAPAAAQKDDDRWLRRCKQNFGNDDQEQYCEVRHAGFRLSGAALSIDPDANGAVEVEGWERDSVAVTIRVQAGARTEEAARALAREVAVQAEGAAIRVSGPRRGRREQWSASLIVMVPRRTGLRVRTQNGPLSVTGVNSTMDLETENGPVSLYRLGGDVRARVQNGPLTVELTGSTWDGKGLDAESVNGPVTLAVPEGYNAELETGTVNGPMVTSIPLTVTLQGRVRDRIRTTLGKGGPPVRVVTTNGPITIRRAGE